MQYDAACNRTAQTHPIYLPVDISAHQLNLLQSNLILSTLLYYCVYLASQTLL